MLLTLANVAACSDREGTPEPSSGTPSPVREVLDYKAALATVPLDGVAGRPLLWSNVAAADRPAEVELVSVVRHWVALEHMLIYSEAPQREKHFAVLRLLATEERVAPVEEHHRGVVPGNSDPWTGPQWIRLLDVDPQAEPARVTLCFDQGFYGRVSEGGGREMLREHRALLVVYSLVKEAVPGEGQRWKVAHERPYAGDDYPEPNTGPDRECKEWADHELEDAP